MYKVGQKFKMNHHKGSDYTYEILSIKEHSEKPGVFVYFCEVKGNFLIHNVEYEVLQDGDIYGKAKAFDESIFKEVFN